MLYNIKDKSQLSEISKLFLEYLKQEKVIEKDKFLHLAKISNLLDEQSVGLGYKINILNYTSQIIKQNFSKNIDKLKSFNKPLELVLRFKVLENNNLNKSSEEQILRLKISEADSINEENLDIALKNLEKVFQNQLESLKNKNKYIELSTLSIETFTELWEFRDYKIERDFQYNELEKIFLETCVQKVNNNKIALIYCISNQKYLYQDGDVLLGENEEEKQESIKNDLIPTKFTLESIFECKAKISKSNDNEEYNFKDVFDELQEKFEYYNKEGRVMKVIGFEHIEYLILNEKIALTDNNKLEKLFFDIKSTFNFCKKNLQTEEPNSSINLKLWVLLEKKKDPLKVNQ